MWGVRSGRSRSRSSQCNGHRATHSSHSATTQTSAAPTPHPIATLRFATTHSWRTAGGGRAMKSLCTCSPKAVFRLGERDAIFSCHSALARARKTVEKNFFHTPAFSVCILAAAPSAPTLQRLDNALSLCKLVPGCQDARHVRKKKSRRCCAPAVTAAFLPRKHRAHMPRRRSVLQDVQCDCWHPVWQRRLLLRGVCAALSSLFNRTCWLVRATSAYALTLPPLALSSSHDCCA